MAIDKKLIYFKTESRFNTLLNNNEIDEKSIVFIEDSKRIWTHGNFFDGDWGGLNNKPSTLDGYGITDAAKKINSLYYVEGNTTGKAGAWTGSIPEVTSLYAGLTIAYKIGVAGASTTNLNLNGLGNKLVRRNTSNLTTHLPVGTVVLLTYDGTRWVWADYHTNTTYAAMPVAEGKAGTAGTLRTMRADYLKQIIEHHIANTVPSAHTLGSHSDVTITSNSNGEILRWNGSKWINNTLAEAGIAAASHTHSYLPLSGGTLTGDLEIFAGNTDKFIKFAYNTTDAYAWRIGYLGTGAGNENRLTFQSAKTSGASYVDALSFGLDDLVGRFAVTPTVGNTKVSLEGHNHTLKLIAGTSTATVDSTADVADPYIRLFSDNAHQGNIRIVGGTNVGVVSKNGVVTLTATDTKYTAGSNITINGSNVIAGNYPSLTKTDLDKGTATTQSVATPQVLASWLSGKNYATVGYVDELEIGGRNLLLDTSSFKNTIIYANRGPIIDKNYNEFTFETGTKNTGPILLFSETLNEDNYVLSFTIVASEATELNYIALRTNATQTTIGTYTSRLPTQNLNEGRNRVEIKFKGILSVNALWLASNLPEVVRFTISDLKLEKGNKPTDWTPAPEDQVSDWSTTDVNSFSFIKNKPTTFAALGLTDNAGSATQPVYFSGGKPVASNATVGGTTTPMYLKAGVITPLNYTLATSVPSGAKFTDENVKYTLATDNQEYRMLMSEYYSTAPTTLGIKYTDNIRINPYLSKITATTFSGNLTGNVTGNASSATALTTNAGSATKPVYFSNGKPVATTYSLGKSVPSNAVFTDTHWTSGIRVGASGTAANTAVTSPYIKVVDNESYREQFRLIGGSNVTITSDASKNITIAAVNTNTTYSNFTRTVSGLVPAPGAATTTRYLREDGTWVIPPNTGDTHWVTGIRAGASGTTTNAAVTNPYIKVLDDSTYRSQIRLVGNGATSISSDASGNITISSTDTTSIPWSSIIGKPTSFAPSSHTHTVGDITGISSARLLGRYSSTTGNAQVISVGSGLSLNTSGVLSASLGSHTHSASDITSGKFDIARIPTGTTSSTVSLGNHTHAVASTTIYQSWVLIAAGKFTKGMGNTNDHYVWENFDVGGNVTTPWTKVISGQTITVSHWMGHTRYYVFVWVHGQDTYASVSNYTPSKFTITCSSKTDNGHMIEYLVIGRP